MAPNLRPTKNRNIKVYTDPDGRKLYAVIARIRGYNGKRSGRFVEYGIHSFQLAELKLAKERSESYERKNFRRGKGADMTVREAWEEYAPICKRDCDTYGDMSNHARHLIRHVGDVTLGELGLAKVDQYRARRLAEPVQYWNSKTKALESKGRPPSRATLNRELTTLRAIVTYQVKCGSLYGNPLNGGACPNLAEHNTRQLVLDPEESLDRYLEACLPHTRIFSLLYYFTGMRKDELLGLRVSQWNPHEEQFDLGIDTKANQPRVVALPPRVAAELKAYLRKSPRGLNDYLFINPRTGTRYYDFRRSAKTAFRAAGFDAAWIHDLRRSFATNTGRAGIDRDVAMRMGGWATDSAFRRYKVVQGTDLKKAAKRLEEYAADQKTGQFLASKESDGTDGSPSGLPNSRKC